MAALSLNKIEAIAPDQASLSAARKLLKLGVWSGLAADGAGLVWGECQGSGATPYRVAISEPEAGYKCTCLSRRFPASMRWHRCGSAPNARRHSRSALRRNGRRIGHDDAGRLPRRIRSRRDLRAEIASPWQAAKTRPRTIPRQRRERPPHANARARIGKRPSPRNWRSRPLDPGSNRGRTRGVSCACGEGVPLDRAAHGRRESSWPGSPAGDAAFTSLCAA